MRCILDCPRSVARNHQRHFIIFSTIGDAILTWCMWRLSTELWSPQLWVLYPKLQKTEPEAQTQSLSRPCRQKLPNRETIVTSDCPTNMGHMEMGSKLFGLWDLPGNMPPKANISRQPQTDSCTNPEETNCLQHCKIYAAAVRPPVSTHARRTGTWTVQNRDDTEHWTLPDSVAKAERSSVSLRQNMMLNKIHGTKGVTTALCQRLFCSTEMQTARKQLVDE